MADSGSWHPDLRGSGAIGEQRAFVRGVAETRYVMRRVVRIVEAKACAHGPEPLQHQLLIQLLGAAYDHPSLKEITARLDVRVAVASGLIKRLEQPALVERHKSTEDRGTTLVRLTEDGRTIGGLGRRDLQPHLDYFQRPTHGETHHLALSVFGSYVCIDLRVADAPAPEAASRSHATELQVSADTRGPGPGEA